MLKLEDLIKNFQKMSICVDTTSSLKKKTCHHEKGIGSGNKPLLARIIKKFFC